MPEIAGQRLRRIGLTRGDIGGSLQPGKISPENLRMAERADRQFPCRGHEFCCPTEGRGDCPHMRVAVEVGKTAHLYTADGKSLEFKWAQAMSIEVMNRVAY